MVSRLDMRKVQLDHLISALLQYNDIVALLARGLLSAAKPLAATKREALPLVLISWKW